MCTSVVEIVGAEGAGKSSEGWFPLTHTVVTFDHPHYAHLEDAVLIDFMNRDRGPGARAAVELSLEAAKALHAALAHVIDEAEESGRHGVDATSTFVTPFADPRLRVNAAE